MKLNRVEFLGDRLGKTYQIDTEDDRVVVRDISQIWGDLTTCEVITYEKVYKTGIILQLFHIL